MGRRNRKGPAFCRALHCAVASRSLADLGVGADAAGADVVAPRDRADGQRLNLNIGFEQAVGARRLALPTAGVLVTDVAAERGVLAAEFAFRCHRTFTLTKRDRWVKPASRRGQTAPRLYSSGAIGVTARTCA